MRWMPCGWWAVRPAPSLTPTRSRASGRDRVNDKWRYDSLSSAWERAHRGTTIAYRTPYQLRHTFAIQPLSR